MALFSRGIRCLNKQRSFVHWIVAGVTLGISWQVASPVTGQTNPLRDVTRSEVKAQEDFQDGSLLRRISSQEDVPHFHDASFAPVGYELTPRHSRTIPVNRRWMRNLDDGQSVIVEGGSVEILPEEVLGEGEFIEGAVIEHGEDCIGCSNGCLIPCPGRWLERVEMFAGAQGVTGPANRGGTGSFGFYEGSNWGAPVGCLPWELGSQVGYRWTQSNFSGAEYSNSDRNQLFLTGGLFRRADWGLQGGAVVDYMRDKWYYENELLQVRGEVSWMNPCAHEVGFWFTANLKDSSSASDLISGPIALEEWQTTDLYAFFYRRTFEDCGAEGRIFVGFSGESDALIGADADVPLNDRWALRGGFTYLIPEESSPGVGFLEESWNVMAGLVFYPGCRTARKQDYNRPLFRVADNGSMLIDRK